MDLLKINIKGNYSNIGKFSAHKLSYVLDKSAHADKILKDKPRKNIIEKSYLERIDNDNLDKSEDKDLIDIFDTNYRDKYNDLLELQKNKYFDYSRSCAMNKKYILEENKNNPEYIKRYRYHIYNHSQLDNKKGLNEEKLLFLDQNQNKDFIYHKLVYSQSFHKMIGRNDKDIIKKTIEKNLKEKLNNNDNYIYYGKNKSNSQKQINLKNKKKGKKIKKKLKKIIKGVEMEKQLQRGILPEHHDVRIRTAKGLDIMLNDKKIRNLVSSLSSTLLINKNNLLNNLNNNNNKKIARLFSSIMPISKNNLLINDNINDKKSNEDKKEIIEKRIFSGFNSIKNINIKSHPQSCLNKNNLIKSGKKEPHFNSDISNINKTTSSNAFNKIKRNIYSVKDNNYSKSDINNKYMKPRLFSTPIHNKAVSFKKMLSRQYVNRVKINDKIGAGLPLTPKYNIIYPKVVMKVMYKKRSNFSKKKEFKGLVGEYLHEVNKKNTISGLNTIQHISNFSKMFGRGTKMNSNFPIFMNNMNSRNAFDFCTEKSLKMNHFSNGKLNNPFSSFNIRKSFNNILSGKNRSKSIDNRNNNNHKESRMDYYNKNINNIFKKVIYDDIVDNNIDNNENKSNENEDLLDLKKNPQLARTINLSYKNLISDYYRLNLDYLSKDAVKDKIDGVTFEIIKDKKLK